MTMFYKARRQETGNMWDVWLAYHHNTYYLYSLCNSGETGWDNISMASSPDGVHWTEGGPILKRRPTSIWMGTGSTWKSPHFAKDGKFQMNFSASEGATRRQTIFFAESTDLENWTRLGDEYEFVQDERWYEREGRWDCIWTLAHPEGGLYGYWTASPKKETGGVFGFGESRDGVTWKARKPPRVSGVGEGEVGAIEKIGRKYVMLYGTHPTMQTLIANKPQGPFTLSAKNATILSGHTYFTRFFQSPGGLLVCHHAIARGGQVSMGLIKGTSVDAEGTLRLTWWAGNEALKHKPLAVPPPVTRSDGPIRLLSRKFNVSGGLVLEGKLRLPKPLAAPRGLYIEHGKGCGTAILFDHDGRAELGAVAADGTGFHAEKTVDREMPFGAPARFRLLLKGELLEIYLDDVLIECYSLPAPATGRIGLIPGDQRNSISALKAWR